MESLMQNDWPLVVSRVRSLNAAGMTIGVPVANASIATIKVGVDYWYNDYRFFQLITKPLYRVINLSCIWGYYPHYKVVVFGWSCRLLIMLPNGTATKK
jgi:hypothetical protein